MRLRATRLSAIAQGTRKIPWTPTQIQTSLWLDAADANTITLNGSTVSQWNDKSGNGRNATQATASRQPIYQAFGINNRPALYWDDTNRHMTTPAFSLANNRQFAIFGAVNMINGDGYRRLIDNTTEYKQGYVGSSASGATYLSMAGIASGITGSSIASYYGNSVISTIFGTEEIGTDAIQMFANGSAGTLVSGNTSTLSTSSIVIGIASDLAGGWWSGRIGELIFIAGNISAARRQQIEGYLAWKWGGV